jgi:hypothetical protein
MSDGARRPTLVVLSIDQGNGSALAGNDVALIERLLSVPFTGRDQLLAQIPYTRVRVLLPPFAFPSSDSDPSMFLIVDRTRCAPAPVDSGAVSFGRYRAGDGWNEVMLNAIEGYLSGVVPLNFTAVVPIPPPEEIEVFVPRIKTSERRMR